MSFGVQVINDYGTFVIDENYINARLVRQDFGFKNTAQYWENEPVLKYGFGARGLNMTYPPLVLVRPNNPAKWFGATIIGGGEYGGVYDQWSGIDIFSQDASAVDVAVFSEEAPGIESADTYGLEVWNSGAKAFTSKSQYPRITHMFLFTQPYSCGTRTFTFSGYNSTPWVIANTLYGSSWSGEYDAGHHGCLVKFNGNGSMTVTHGGDYAFHTSCSGLGLTNAAGPGVSWFIALCKINEGA